MPGKYSRGLQAAPVESVRPSNGDDDASGRQVGASTLRWLREDILFKTRKLVPLLSLSLSPALFLSVFFYLLYVNSISFFLLLLFIAVLSLVPLATLFIIY